MPFERSLHDGLEGGAEGRQEAVFEAGVRDGRAGQRQLLLAAGDQERMPVAVEADRGPSIEPDIFALRWACRRAFSFACSADSA